MDKRRFIALGALIVAAIAFTLFFMKTGKEDNKVFIGKSNIKVEDGRLTPEWRYHPMVPESRTRCHITVSRKTPATRLYI